MKTSETLCSHWLDDALPAVSPGDCLVGFGNKSLNWKTFIRFPGVLQTTKKPASLEHCVWNTLNYLENLFPGKPPNHPSNVMAPKEIFQNSSEYSMPGSTIVHNRNNPIISANIGVKQGGLLHPKSASRQRILVCSCHKESMEDADDIVFH